VNNLKKEIKKIIPFTVTPKSINHLRTYLARKLKDLYTESYKMLLKEYKENLINVKIS